MNPLKKRIFYLNLVLCLVFGGIVIRLFWLQILRGETYEAYASRQQTIRKTLSGRRGEILVHEKDQMIELATIKDGWLLAIDPRYIKDPKELYNKFSEVGVQISEEEFMDKAAKKEDPYEVIAHRISHETKRKIVSAGLAGLIYEPEEWRYYPAGTLASQLIGFVGVDSEGKYAIERLYNNELEGKDGIFEGEKTLSGKLLLFGKRLIKPEKNGSDLVLTIDAGVQSYIEKKLEEVREKYGARSAGGVVMDPKTGKILAMAARPAFDPNLYSKERDQRVFINPHVENTYEMGSIVKALTIAAAMDAGAVTLETMYNDTGKIVLDGAVIENFDGKARGRIPMQEILSQSLNVGAAFLAEKLGKDAFRMYMHKFGLGDVTGVDLPGEAKGNLKNLESPRSLEYATASFGQGISMTPLEFVRAISSIANGGYLVRPYIVEEIRREGGINISRRAEGPINILKEETSRTVTRMLVEVVDKKLAGGHGRIPGYSVAAKTGTAQIARDDKRGYSEDFLHTFFGYGPAYDPKFLVFFYLERPRGIRYASESLTDPFRSTMRFLLSYYEIPPDRPQDLVYE